MTSKKRFLATLDIETKDGLKGSKFGVGGFYMQHYNKENTPSIIERDFKTFFKKVFEVMKDKKVLCFIHNQDFDIRFVIEYCIKEMKIQPKIIQTNSKILQVIIPDTQIIFRDSLQFLLCSQDKAEKVFLLQEKREKVTVNFVEVIKMFNSKNKELIEKAYKILEKRVNGDIRGLYKIMLKFQELFKEEYKLNIFNYVTLPSFSVALYRKKLKEEYNLYFSTLNPYLKFYSPKGYSWRSENHRNLYDWTRLSYFGGRNDIFDLNYNKNVYYYDKNSLYPSVCIKNKFPTPKEYYILYCPEKEDFYNNIKGKHLYIIEAEVQENITYPVLPIRDEKDSVKFVNGVKTGVWCSPQFERFLEFDENLLLSITKIRVYTEKKFYLRGFMKESFDKKKKYTIEGIKEKVMIEKRKMNAFTGKPAQKYNKEQWVLFNNEYLQELENGNSGKREGEIRKIDIIEYSKDYRLIKILLKSLKDFMIVEWTCFTTSYAQVEMHKTFYKLEKEKIKFYYCDTDCIFTNKALELNENLVKEIGNDVLQLKNELVPKGWDFIEEKELYYNPKIRDFEDVPKFDEVKFYLPKTYVTKKDNKFNIIAKGINKFMLHETLGIDLIYNEKTEKQLHNYLNSFEKIEKLLFDTGVQMDRYLKYKSSLRQKSKLISHAVIKRKVKKVYDKRKILEDFNTIPFTFREMQNLKQVRTENLNMFLGNDKMNYVISEAD